MRDVVIAIGRDSGRLERLSSSGAKVIPADLACVGELRAAVGEIGHLDALIHCAGVSAVASGMRAVPRWAAFVGSKAALRELADSPRLEEAGRGVRVTTVFPAGTATERLRSTRAAFGQPYDPERCIQPDSLAKMIAWILAAPPDAYVAELSVFPAANPTTTGADS
jgi:short chain dehydrogenase